MESGTTMDHGDRPVFDARSVVFDAAFDEKADPDLRAFRHAYRWVIDQVEKNGLVTTSTGVGPVPYPIAPAVAVLDPVAEPEIQRRVLSVVSALHRILQGYSEDAGLREYLQIPEHLARWVDRDLERGPARVDLCRFDLVGASLGSLRVLEFNCNCPGGLLYSGMVDTYWRAAPGMDAVISAWGAPPSRIEHETWFADWLLGLGRRNGGGREPADVTLFRPDHGNQLELEQMAAQLSRLGVTAKVCDATRYGAGHGPGVGYLKHSVPVDADPSAWTEFCEAVVTGRLTIPSGLAGRWIADNKLCLAVMSDPRFDSLFKPEERQAINALVPFSRRFGDGISKTEVLASRGELVAKRAYGTQGRYVVVGREVTAERWQDLIRNEAGGDWLFQEYVPTGSVGSSTGERYRDLSPCVVDGEIWGYASRISGNALMNVAQGGARQPVFTVVQAEDTGAGGES
ncbi:hypothetical protein ABH926_003721 [Catenulispora sp. GP43]|uniref:hypothetical protein n=1 Tax=Catenulispora sp. GP43 TaxID=3156263 RepID=UPI00351908C1